MIGHPALPVSTLMPAGVSIRAFSKGAFSLGKALILARSAAPIDARTDRIQEG
jgi:hypothetical protein